VLSEVAQTALQHLTDLAPTLKEAELRILLQLTAIAQATPDNPNHTIRISSRELAKLTKLARPALQRALDSLAHRGIITTRQGTATKASSHQLNYLATVKMGGSFGEPPPQTRRLSSSATPDLFESQSGSFGMPPGGSFAEPPTTENEGVPDPSRARVEIDYDSDVEKLLDRVFRSKPKDFDAGQLEQAKALMHKHRCLLGRERNPHAPDDTITAQFLAIAPWHVLQLLLWELIQERIDPGETDGWYITVALNRIYKIKAEVTKEVRQKFKLLKRGATTAGAPQNSTTEGQEFATSLVDQALQQSPQMPGYGRRFGRKK
jgi:hypothetical protein